MSLVNQIAVTVDELSAITYPISIHLNQTVQEEITGDGTWQDVGTNVNLIDPAPENCTYTGGSINVNSAVSCTRYLRAEVNVSAISAATTITLSAGESGSPNTDHTVSTTMVNANGEDLLTIEVPVHITKNITETVDFFIKADKNFNIKNAQFRFGKKLTNGVI